MADSIVTHHATKISVTEVQDIQVTEIVSDEGEYVRAIRVFGMPGGTGSIPVVELLLRSDDQNKIKVTTPEIDF